jgi:7,8-dihydropterin-6-yl-methyl-4-(beta-D-ribofuranosyl)aminobenzene 5'-phosphate synthase
MPKACRDALLGGQCRFIPSRGSVEVAPSVYATGEIPRLHPEEAITESFCCDPEGRVPDPLLDDQALFLETSQGIVVLLGCAHSGIINTLDFIQELTEGNPLHAVIGGMHLRSASEDRIQWTIRELHRFNLNVLAPMHCTGPKAIAELWTAFPHTCQAVGVGTDFVF